MKLLTCFFVSQQKINLSYSECNQILTLSKLGIKKLKFPSWFLLSLDPSGISIYHSSFLDGRAILKYWFFLYMSLRNLFISTFLGFLSGFRIVGRGYKAYLSYNNLIFRLGYSHNVYYSMPFFVKTFHKEKIKNFWLLRSLDQVSLTTIANMIKSFRRGNVYRVKGTYSMYEEYPRKYNKKSVLL